MRRQLVRHQQVKRHQRLFYVGMAAGGSLDHATKAAFLEITKQLTWLPPGSQDLLRGLYRVDRTATDREGQVHLLAVLERAAAAAHLRRLAVERRGALKSTLNGCGRTLQAGELAAARTCARTARRQLAEVRQLLAAEKAAVGDPARATSFPEERDAAKLFSRLQEGASRTRTILLHVLRVVDGKRAGDLDHAFRKVATRRGFRLAGGAITEQQVDGALEGSTAVLADVGRAAGAGYVIVGRVRARFSSEEMGQFFAWARGQLRIIETTSGRGVADLSYEKIKGGHISREKACAKAIDNTVVRLRSALSQKLAELH